MDNQIVTDENTTRGEVVELCESVLEYSYNRRSAYVLRRLATAIESVERLERAKQCSELKDIKERLHKAIHEDDIRMVEFYFREFKLVLSVPRTKQKLSDSIVLLRTLAK